MESNTQNGTTLKKKKKKKQKIAVTGERERRDKGKNEEEKKVAAVDIRGIDKEELLHELWKYAAIAPYFKVPGMSVPSYDRERALEQLRTGYVYYLLGKYIVIDFNGTKIDPTYYDELVGRDTFQIVVECLRMKGKTWTTKPVHN